jgi:DNA-binding transcriptional regulator YhcF (GntR family)
MRSPNNLLLGALSAGDLAALSQHLTKVSLTRGEVLFEPSDLVRTVHFPIDSTVLAITIPMLNGSTVETVAIGREGAVGGVVSQGLVPAFGRALTQFPGLALRIDILDLQTIKRGSETVANLFTRYSDCLVAQLQQGVACNAQHTAEQRVVRWLLETQDRVGDEVPLTQEYLAQMLGIHRSYLNKAAKALQAAGLIRYHRGFITITNRTGLEQAACECYARVRAHYENVLAGVYPSGERH